MADYFFSSEKNTTELQRNKPKIEERVRKMNREREFEEWGAEMILNHIITICSLNLVQKRQNALWLQISWQDSIDMSVIEVSQVLIDQTILSTSSV